MNEEKLMQFIRQELPDTEKEKVLDWIESSEENYSVYAGMKNAWVLSCLMDERIPVNIQEKYERLKKKIPSLGSRKNFRFLKVAALVLFFFASGYLLEKSQMNHVLENRYSEYVVPNGQFSNILLSDGTMVYLNSGSTMRVASSFFHHHRNILLEGEAFFEVAKDKKHPFVVKTSDMDVVVTGTSFNVQAYRESDEINVTLIKGRVFLNGTGGEKIASLNPGENIAYDKISHKEVISQVDIRKYISWRDGVVTFKNEKLEAIFGLLERWYNVRIEYKEEELKDILFSGTLLRYKPIDQVLEILRLTSGIQYEIKSYPNKPNCITIKTNRPMENK